MNTENKTTENQEISTFFTAKNLGYFFLILALIIFIISLPFKNMDDQTQKNMASENQDLTEEQRYILVEQGTEAPFSSDLLKEKRAGTYYAADTKKPVFRSEDKYDSGTGWPSFTQPIKPDAVIEKTDEGFGMARTEITSTAGGHLGHVFTDGPKDKTGLRYCMNGDALYFIPDGDKESSQ